MRSFSLILLLIFCCASSIHSQTKRSLVIAIGEYAPNNGHGWKKISSANDTALLLPALKNQGFNAENTHVLVNKEATIQAIRKSFHQLILSSKNGDIVVIHISSHGEQVEDDNDDELDGLDETIVTYNAISPRYTTNFEKDQEEYLRDDELGSILDSIRTKLGPKGDLCVVLDNCHSGSGTRAVGEIVRGGEPPLLSSKKPIGQTKKDQAIFKGENSSNSDLSPFILISAARAEELNTEIKINNVGYGSLSFAFCQALQDLPNQFTYQALFTKIQSTMNENVPRQHPVIEGNGLDRTLFGGNFVQQQAFISLKSVEDPKLITLRAGIIAGLTTQSTVAVYPVGTVDTTKALISAKGTVISSDNFTSVVELDRPLTSTQSGNYWAFIKKRHYPIRPIVVGMYTATNNHKKVSLPQTTKTSLINTGLVTLEGNVDVYIYPGTACDSLVDVHSGYTWQIIEKDDQYENNLQNALTRYAQYVFLKSYTINDKNYNIEVQIIPVINGKADTSWIDKKKVNGLFEFKEGDQFILSVRNFGPKKIYFNVIDLQPDGIINPIMPNKVHHITKEELFVEANSTKAFSSTPINIYPPIGDEVFKIFVSKDPLDMEFIAINKNKTTRNFMTDLETMFKNSYRPSTRGDFGSNEGAVLNLNFRIVH